MPKPKAKFRQFGVLGDRFPLINNQKLGLTILSSPSTVNVDLPVWYGIAPYVVKHWNKVQKLAAGMGETYKDEWMPQALIIVLIQAALHPESVASSDNYWTSFRRIYSLDPDFTVDVIRKVRAIQKRGLTGENRVWIHFRLNPGDLEQKDAAVAHKCKVSVPLVKKVRRKLAALDSSLS